MTGSASEDTRKTRGRRFAAGCLVLVLVVSLIGGSIGTCFSDDLDSSEETLNAEVKYVDGQFTITNNDDFAWVNVKFDLNYEAFYSGYTHRTARLDAHSVYTAGSMQFAKSDGTTFNPLAQKPLRFQIRCEAPDGTGWWYWYGDWE